MIHISVADPFCPELQNAILDVASEQELKIHKEATYVCIEGPRFSTKAESKFYKSTGAEIIGMTLVPECQLAREAQICYASISTVTDYDVWAEKPVTAKEVIESEEEIQTFSDMSNGNYLSSSDMKEIVTVEIDA